MNSLGRALKLLDMMGRQSGGFTNSQISRYLQISTSSTSYLLRQLEWEGCVTRDEDTGRYHVGLRLVSLARGAMRANGLQKLSGPAIRRLVDSTRLTAMIGVLDRGEVLLIERTSYKDSVETGADFTVGERLPRHESAIGKVLVAFLPSEQTGHLGACSPEELKGIRMRGYATVDSQGIRTVAVPITNRIGGVQPALAVTGLISNPIWTDGCAVINMLREAAFQISKRNWPVQRVSEPSSERSLKEGFR